MSTAKALVFEKHGEPSDALSFTDQQVPEPKETEVQIDIIAAPINPSDINTVQGKYPLIPPLPGVPGHEGVGRVIRAGSKVQQLSPGDHVVPLASAVGTWRSSGVWAAADWHKIPADLPVPAAGTLCINPPTALCMLENIVQLEPGDVVVQNGATSAVGQHVIQFAKAKGLKTVNVIRDRSDWDATVSWLKDMGADVVTTEGKLKGDLADAGLPAPKLALNCVGGSSAAAIAKVLAAGGTHVTYGAMSMQPLVPPVPLLIFKDITFKGFWISGGWAKRAGPAAHADLLDRVVDHYKQGNIQPPHVQEFPLSRYLEALEAAQTQKKQYKVVLVPDKE
jgi:trans-2-enoyl-CoA reductase